MALNKKQKDAFASLSAAILATAGGFVYAAMADVAPFVAEGLVEVNEAMTNEQGQFAVRLKQEGIQNESSGASEFALDDGIAMPATKRGRQGDTYPFDKMGVGQSFFIAATAEKPNPAKAMASTVSSATARYAVGTGEFETVKVKQYAVDESGKRVRNEAGELVVIGETTEQREVTKTTRKFEVRAVDETAQGRGPGARIWRTA